MKRVRVVIGLATAGILSFGLTSLAQVIGPDITHSPGWQYGGYNCGCYANVNATNASCRACCTAAEIPMGPLTPGQVQNCFALCDQTHYPCNGTPGGD
ncbi:MAG: hypothetical protein IT437_05560 [Phycisphaerales bacterium]|nr:hypothetical protein [Phycisphaerales bacterium]